VSIKTDTRSGTEKFLTELMRYESPMMQPFILEAVQKYAEHLISNKDEYIKQNENSWLEPRAWVSCATTYVEKYAKYIKDSK
jgi:hypothetical protein